MSGPELYTSNNNCLYCPSEITEIVTKNNDKTKWHIWVDKIAQIGTVFPIYFHNNDVNVPNYKSFTTEELLEGSWYFPKSPTQYKFGWEKYLIENPTVKELFETDKVKFYKTFFEQFLIFIQNQEDEFWDVIQNLSADAIADHLRYEPHFVAKSKPFTGKIEKGLETLWNQNSFITKYENAFIHLLSACNDVDKSPLALNFLENLGIKNVYLRFDDAGGPDNRIRFTLTTSALLGKLPNDKYYPKLNNHLPIESLGESDESLPLINTNISTLLIPLADFTSDNKIQLANLDEVDYDVLIPIKFITPFTLEGQSYKKGSIVLVPAIQAKLMQEIAKLDKVEMVSWVAVDIGLTYFSFGGLTGIRRVYAGTSTLKKIFLTTELAGSVLYISSQLLDSGVLTPEQERHIQIASIVSSIPSISLAIKRINKVVDELDEVIRSKYPKNEVLDEMVLAKEKLTEKVIEENNKTNLLGPELDPIEDSKTLVAIDDPVNGMTKRMANEITQGAGYACLVGSTPILTKNGYTTLENIKEQDQVLTSSGYTKVIKKIKTVAKSLVLITLCNGEILQASPDHIFYNERHEYITAKNISSKTILLNKDGEPLEICEVAKKDTILEVYDLVTEDVNYAVGQSELLTGTCILRFLAENKTVYPNLYNNYKVLDKSQRAILVQNLYEARKNSVLEDFANFLNEQSGFNAYKAYSTYKVDVLIAVKNIQLQGKLYNGAFNVRLNPGCIGHFDDDVKIVLLDEGWELVEESSTYYSFEKIIGIYPSGTPKKAYFNFNVGTSGGEHGPNVSYWKLNELTTSNQGVIYRSTNDPAFQFNPNISGSVYLKGVKIK